jgi:hypothetical protein
MQYQGGCHCGAVRFSYSGEALTELPGAMRIEHLLRMNDKRATVKRNTV